MHAQHGVHANSTPWLHVMKVTTEIALRANLVLFLISTSIAIAPCLGVALLLGLLDDGMSTLPCEGGTFLLASLVMLLLRWCARRAFDLAIETNKIQLPEQPDLEASIADDCSHAWLVQLHLELHGQPCVD